MKKIIFSLLCSSLFLGVFAQDDSLLNEKNITIGGFGGPTFEIGLAPNAGLTAGGIGGVSINNFFVGGFGMGGDYGETLIEDITCSKSFSLGGIVVGYIFPPNEEVHFYTSLKAGWGTASLSGKGSKSLELTDNIFAINPELGMEINITPWSRFVISASYRVVDGVDDLLHLNNHDFENYSVGLALRFGDF